MNSKCVDHGDCPSQAMDSQAISSAYQSINPQWKLSTDTQPQTISREFKFDKYLAGLDFANKIATIAEKQNHHPEIIISYKVMTVRYWTHNAKLINLSINSCKSTKSL